MLKYCAQVFVLVLITSYMRWYSYSYLYSEYIKCLECTQAQVTSASPHAWLVAIVYELPAATRV